jgi:NTP pyrophosphatase (non-canonical NTP hydrolase)
VQHLSALAGAASSATGPDADAAFGDLLFEVVALAQQAGVDPEGALRRTASQHLSGDGGGAPDGLVQFPTPPSD